MFASLEDVKKFLPHRDPFLFVDSVESVVLQDGSSQNQVVDPKDLQGSKVIAHYRTKKDHPIVEGHFPSRPILPGVVQIEMMAQVASFVCSKLHENPFSGKIHLDVALVAVDNAKFRRPVFPEQDLVIEATLTRIRLPMVGFSCKIFSDEKLISECDVMASVRF